MEVAQAMTQDDPAEIADYLIEQHGLDGALSVAMEKTADQLEAKGR